jgi:hypothetical protein
MKPKEWLYKNGHIKEIGRGRMSREHIALIEQAVRDGVTIEGYGISSVVPKSETEKSAPMVEKVAVAGNRVMDVPDERRPESSWTAHTSEGEIGMRTVCNGCKNSLTYCYCPQSRVWLNHETEGVVFFKPRTAPMPRRKW